MVIVVMSLAPGGRHTRRPSCVAFVVSSRRSGAADSSGCASLASGAALAPADGWPFRSLRSWDHDGEDACAVARVMSVSV